MSNKIIGSVSDCLCSAGWQQRKRLASEGNDKSEPCLEGKTDSHGLSAGLATTEENSSSGN